MITSDRLNDNVEKNNLVDNNNDNLDINKQPINEIIDTLTILDESVIKPAKIDKENEQSFIDVEIFTEYSYNIKTHDTLDSPENIIIDNFSYSDEFLENHIENKSSLEGLETKFDNQIDGSSPENMFIFNNASEADKSLNDNESCTVISSNHISNSYNTEDNHSDHFYNDDTLEDNNDDIYVYCDNKINYINQYEDGDFYATSDLEADDLACEQQDEYILAHYKNVASHDKMWHNNKSSLRNNCEVTNKYELEYANKYGKSGNYEMCVDTNEEKWGRLDGVSLRDDILEYALIHHSDRDSALAQALDPFTMHHNYFEIEILEVGISGTMAIGATKKNYPSHQHPGWCDGSIAYHADDGKLFAGKGIGDIFGPVCKKGDRMGCGILFPRNYDPNIDGTVISNKSNEDVYDGENNDILQIISKREKGFDLQFKNFRVDRNDEIQNDYEDQNIENLEISGTSVEVYFTKNGRLVGCHWSKIPYGGYYPTVGMLSQNEKVRVYLRPMTG